MNDHGYLELHIGPMFSGKTSAIVNKANTFVTVVKLDTIYISHTVDKRDEDSIDGSYSTHDSTTILNDEVDRIKVDKLSNTLFIEKICKYDIICIDEAQFFDDLFEVVQTLILEYQKTVYVSGLVGDSKMMKFGQIGDLLCMADSIINHKAICLECMKKTGTINTDAQFTINVKGTDDDRPIGGAEIYASVCRKCFMTRGK